LPNSQERRKKEFPTLLHFPRFLQFVLIQNTIGESGVICNFEHFSVTDPTEGRLKRIINYQTTVAMPMDLHSFPFDLQQVPAELLSISHWRQLNGARHGE
jgi:hypothetical protein